MSLYYLDSSNHRQARQRSEKVREGEWLMVSKRIYSDDLKMPLKQQVASAIIKIIGHAYPELVISHRSAFEYRIHDDCIYVTGSRSRKRDIHGIKIVEVPGPKFIPEYDQQIMGAHISGTERMLLENLEVSRGLHKSLGQTWVEEWLETTLGRLGENELNRIRGQARVITEYGGWDKEFKKLDSIIGSLLGSHKGHLISKLAAARSHGDPYDKQRVELFSGLASYIKRCQFIYRRPQSDDLIAHENAAFWDAYFSNYIEGTRFPVVEAEDIIFNRNVNESMHEDSHNIMRSFDILSDRVEMNILPKSADDLLDILVMRHRYFMDESPEKKPGEFKAVNNVAGNTIFVEPDRVEGTLSRAFHYYSLLDCAVAKAMYIMFVIAEVHPFIDGNGRMARKMMNAELISAGLERILIPTCFRDDYLLGLRSVTRNNNYNSYCRMLDRAHHFTATFNYLKLEETTKTFEKLGVFEEGKFARLPELAYRKNMSVFP
ncbi:MAG: Fic family protein [Thiohalomonadales bacterium]